ncbi:MAG: hypothetical protein FWJ34_09330 [Geminocystis sp. GBBB08]|nr:hypothetical protein [Geminocystis sp. GBBB08]
MGSTIMGLILLGFALGGFNNLRLSFIQDKGIADVNQRLKTTLAAIGPDMQQIGQGIVDTNIPLVELKVFNANQATEYSEMTIKKTIIPVSLTLKEALIKGQSNTTLKLDSSSDIIGQWKSQRIANGGKIKAYIFNKDLKKGEYFEYVGENMTTVPPTLTVTSQTWTENYPVNSTIYLMDKRQYKVESNTLKLIIKDDTTGALELAEYVDKLNINVTLKNDDGTESICKQITETAINCTPTVSLANYKFENIKSIEVKATVKQKNENNPSQKQLRPEDLTMSQKFFIRNTL